MRQQRACVTGTVAVMQPYFYPYADYFALLAAAETFVIYDCVQFPRRGRVHRSEVGPAGARDAWLTLPVAKAQRGTPISGLWFASGATAEFQRRLSRHPFTRSRFGNLPGPVRDHLQAPLVDVCGYLEQGLETAANLLDFEARIVRSSRLSIDPEAHGQDRVIAIVRALNGKRYINASGGRALYDPERFARYGLQLQFLPTPDLRHRSLLPALAFEREEVASQVRAVAAAAR